jgi:hypothetical protein
MLCALGPELIVRFPYETELGIMHPHILMELAHIRTDTLIDEARRTAWAARLRQQARQQARRSATLAADGCLRCGRSPCTCPAPA